MCARMLFALAMYEHHLVEKQIPEQAKELGISEEDVIKKVMFKETVDGEFTTADDVANVALFFASFDLMH